MDLTLILSGILKKQHVMIKSLDRGCFRKSLGFFTIHPLLFFSFSRKLICRVSDAELLGFNCGNQLDLLLCTFGLLEFIVESNMIHPTFGKLY
ncbi:Uncharacterized protein BVS141_14410 [Bacillus velezensis]|nr:Uncharacterized protein BVS141_14410 [Bacillus velezensis]